MNDVMIVFLNRAAYDKYKLNEEYYELLLGEEKKAEKDSDKDETKDKESKSDEILVELENIQYRIVRLTLASSDLGDAYITKDGKKPVSYNHLRSRR